MGMGLRYASRRASVDPGHLSRVERGKGAASMAVLEMLATGYGFVSVKLMLKRAENLANRGGGG